MTEIARTQLRESVLQSLRMVIDPELGENLVDLGLIYRIDVDEQGSVSVDMTTTTRGCPAAGFLKNAVQSAVWIVTGVKKVDVNLTYEPPWTPERITEALQHKFGASVERKSR